MEQKEKWALISVYDKNGIIDFAGRLMKMGWKIISSGGTARKLAGAGIEVKDVADWVGGKAILDHKVVTLSREVHAALLADTKLPEEMQTIVDMDLGIIDLVVCDFYPLATEIAKLPLENSVTEFNGYVEKVIEQTDIGDPTMVRSGAKGGRTVICRTQDREPVLRELEEHKTISNSTRQKLRATAEYVVAGYCLDSARFHGNVGWDLVHGYVPPSNEPTCSRFNGMVGELVQTCRYGENACQSPAGLYKAAGCDDPLVIDKFKGIGDSPAPSFNNYCDIDRLLQTMSHIEAVYKDMLSGHTPNIMVGVKHGNPCGAAVSIHSTANKQIRLAKDTIMGDSLAIFGGWIMTNFMLTDEILEAIARTGMKGGKTRLLDGIIAPCADKEAIDLFKEIKSIRRLLVNPAIEMGIKLDTAPRIRPVRGGFLMQPNYTFVPDFTKMEVYGRRHKSYEDSLALAWAIGCTSNSNTITIVKNKMLIGNGVGQTARVWAAKLATNRAIDLKHENMLKGAVAYSDSFFPYPDAVNVLIKYGIRAIFSTSGSKAKGGGDTETIKACKGAGVTLYMLSDREARGFFSH